MLKGSYQKQGQSSSVQLASGMVLMPYDPNCKTETIEIQILIDSDQNWSCQLKLELSLNIDIKWSLHKLRSLKCQIICIDTDSISHFALVFQDVISNSKFKKKNLWSDVFIQNILISPETNAWWTNPEWILTMLGWGQFKQTYKLGNTF